MFKTVAFACFLILCVTAKRHRQDEGGDEFTQCLFEHCSEEVQACLQDDQCFDVIDHCSHGGDDQGPDAAEGAVEAEEGGDDKIVKCLQKDENSFNLIKCAVQSCSPQEQLQLSRSQKKTVQRVLRKMH